MSTSILVAVYVLFVTGVLLREQIVLGKQSSRSWEELVASLHPTRTEALIKVAAFVSTGKQPCPSFCKMFAEIGGPEGLRRIQKNGIALMALAAYIEMWSVQANTDVITRMRHDGLKLRHMTIKLRLVSKYPGCHKLASQYLIKTAAPYCGIVEQLLVVCETVHVARYPALVAAVNF